MDEYAKASLEDGRSLDDDDHEFQDWVKSNRPEFGPLDRRKVERSLIEESATTRAKSEMQGKIDVITRKQKELELRPQVDRQVVDFTDKIIGMIDNDAIKSMRNDGLEAASSKYPLETAAYTESINQAAALAKDYLGFANNVSEYDQNNSNHAWLLDFINRNGEWFEQNGGDSRVRDGKTFVNRGRYAELARSGQAEKNWTFDNTDILDLIAANAVQSASGQIERTTKIAEQYGFVRSAQENSATGKKVGATLEQDVQPMTPPKSTPSVSPGSADTEPHDTQRPLGQDVLETLGMS